MLHGIAKGAPAAPAAQIARRGDTSAQNALAAATAAPSGPTSDLSPMEAELLIRGLTPLPMEDMGTSKWKEHRRLIERLNIASHQCAVEKKDDYVLRYLLAEEKMPVLLQWLLSAEAWRVKILNKGVIRNDDTDGSAAAAASGSSSGIPGSVIRQKFFSNPVGNYLYGYVESLIVNLFECIFFHAEAVTDGLGDDILELIEYCWRQIASVILSQREDQVNKIVMEMEDPKKMMEMNEEERFLKFEQPQQNMTRAMSCISILWFIIDRMKELPLAVKNLVLVKCDLIGGMADVIVAQPWIRRGRVAPASAPSSAGAIPQPPPPPGVGGGQRIQKFIQGRFTDLSSREDAMLLCPVEAHAWFSMHYLLCDIQCRREYGYTQFKKERILKIKRFLNEMLIDQLPALVDVQRAVEELSFLEPPVGTEEKFRQTLIVEQVPRIKQYLEKGVNWKKVEELWMERLTDPAAMMVDANKLAEMFGNGAYDDNA